MVTKVAVGQRIGLVTLTDDLKTLLVPGIVLGMESGQVRVRTSDGEELFPRSFIELPNQHAQIIWADEYAQLEGICPPMLAVPKERRGSD